MEENPPPRDHGHRDRRRALLEGAHFELQPTQAGPPGVGDEEVYEAQAITQLDGDTGLDLSSGRDVVSDSQREGAGGSDAGAGQQADPGPFEP